MVIPDYCSICCWGKLTLTFCYAEILGLLLSFSPGILWYQLYAIWKLGVLTSRSTFYNQLRIMTFEVIVNKNVSELESEKAAGK